MELERENKRLKILIIILLVFIVAFGGYFYYISFIKNNNKINVNNNNANDTINNDKIQKSEETESKNEESEETENKNEESEDNDDTINKENTANEQYTYDTFCESVFWANDNDKKISSYLTFYNNKTIFYELTDYDGNLIAKYFGTFTIDNDIIVFNVLSGYNKNNQYVILKDSFVINFKITKEYEITDLNNNLNLNRINHSPREGGSPLYSFEEILDN